jgi:hypothetical protein
VCFREGTAVLSRRSAREFLAKTGELRQRLKADCEPDLAQERRFRFFFRQILPLPETLMLP